MEVRMGIGIRAYTLLIIFKNLQMILLTNFIIIQMEDYT